MSYTLHIYICLYKISQHEIKLNTRETGARHDKQIYETVASTKKHNTI